MYTKYIWEGLQTEMGILGKQNLTYPLKEACLLPMLCSECNIYTVQAGVCSADTKPDYSKSPTLKSASSNPLLLHDTPPKNTDAKDVISFATRLVFQSQFYCLSKTRHVSGCCHVNFHFME